MGIEDVFENAGFWILSAVGYVAFFMMIFILKSMDQGSLMPMWVKIAVVIVIPFVAALFSGALFE